MKNHRGDVALAHDSVRQERLGTLGWHIVRVTWDQIVRDPASVVRRVRHALLRREAGLPV
jgi:very-short-patch-repair endonuclease